MLIDVLLLIDDKYRTLKREVQGLHDSLVDLRNIVQDTDNSVSRLGSSISGKQVFRTQDLTALEPDMWKLPCDIATMR